jgi:hypothetical protein
MKHFYRNPFLRIAAALLTVLTLSLTAVSPALALDLNPNDYFQFTLNPVTFDKSQVAVGDVFHITITGRAACTKDLPVPVSEVSITSQVVARPAAGGAALTLNPQYIIDINPVPNKAGQAFDINQSVAVQFPAGAAPGNYDIVGLLTSAKVKVTLVWIDVTGSFPKEQDMGTVKLIAPGTAPAPSQPAGATSPPSTIATGPPPTSPYPSPPSETPASGMTTLLLITVVVLIIIVVVLIIVVIVVMRRRTM